MLIRRRSYAPGSIWFQAKIDTPRRSRGGQLLCWPLGRPPLGMFGQAVVIGRYAEHHLLGFGIGELACDGTSF
jgi:hypothetical protein